MRHLTLNREYEERCRKFKYPSEKDARAGILNSWQDGIKVRSFYWCTTCQGFHLTSKKPQKTFRRL